MANLVSSLLTKLPWFQIVTLEETAEHCRH
jgi:hypothetical protein